MIIRAIQLAWMILVALGGLVGAVLIPIDRGAVAPEDGTLLWVTAAAALLLLAIAQLRDAKLSRGTRVATGIGMFLGFMAALYTLLTTTPTGYLVYVAGLGLGLLMTLTLVTLPLLQWWLSRRRD